MTRWSMGRTPCHSLTNKYRPKDNVAGRLFFEKINCIYILTSVDIPMMRISPELHVIRQRLVYVRSFDEVWMLRVYV